MTELLLELRELPVDAVLDGERVALGDQGWPWFPHACERLRNGKTSIPLMYVIFDVLELESESTMQLPFRERRRLLASLPAARAAVADLGCLGRRRGAFHGGTRARASRASSRSGGTSTYRPVERGWVKRKNRAYWRWELERERRV